MHDSRGGLTFSWEDVSRLNQRCACETHRHLWLLHSMAQIHETRQERGQIQVEERCKYRMNTGNTALIWLKPVGGIQNQEGRPPDTGQSCLAYFRTAIDRYAVNSFCIIPDLTKSLVQSKKWNSQIDELKIIEPIQTEWIWHLHSHLHPKRQYHRPHSTNGRLHISIRRHQYILCIVALQWILASVVSQWRLRGNLTWGTSWAVPDCPVCHLD